MSLTLKCDRCGDKLDEPGALVLSPPVDDEHQPLVTFKYHVCVECWTDLLDWLKEP